MGFKKFKSKNVFLSMILCSVTSFSLLYADNLKECQSKEDKKSECVEKEYYDNGNLKAETPYRNGKAEGVGKFYKENGNLKAEIPFKNDSVNGDIKLYTKDGKLLALIKVENQFINGKCFNNKVLTDKELKEFRRIGDTEEVIIYLQEICPKESDSK